MKFTAFLHKKLIDLLNDRRIVDRPHFPQNFHCPYSSMDFFLVDRPGGASMQPEMSSARLRNDPSMGFCSLTKKNGKRFPDYMGLADSLTEVILNKSG